MLLLTQQIMNRISWSTNKIIIFKQCLRNLAIPVMHKTNLAKKEETPEKTEFCPILPKIACFDFNDNPGAILYGTGDLRLEQIPVPKYTDTEILIAVECVGLSPSDLSLVSKGKHKDYTLDEPLVLGHEASGTVVEVGCEVKKIRPADRVVIQPHIHCGICEFCKCGRFNLCSDQYLCGMPNSHGTLTRYFAWPEEFCLKLPDHISFEEGALLEYLAVAQHACRRAGVTIGSKVLICGAGPMGLVNMMCAKACGATKIAVLDTKGDRLRLAINMGASEVISVKKDKKDETLLKEIREALNGKAHMCLECTGAPQAINIASEAIMPGGTLVLIGVNAADVSVRTKCTTQEIDIRGVKNYCNNFQNALDLLATGRLDFRRILTHNYKLEDIKEALDAAVSGRAMKILIHPNPKWIPTRRRN